MIRVSAPEDGCQHHRQWDSFTAGFIYGRMMEKGIEGALRGGTSSAVDGVIKESVSSGDLCCRTRIDGEGVTRRSSICRDKRTGRPLLPLRALAPTSHLLLLFVHPNIYYVSRPRFIRYGAFHRLENYAALQTPVPISTSNTVTYVLICVGHRNPLPWRRNCFLGWKSGAPSSVPKPFFPPSRCPPPSASSALVVQPQVWPRSMCS